MINDSKITKQIRTYQIYSIFSILLLTLSLVGLLSVGRAMYEKGSVKGANTLLVNKVDDKSLEKYYSESLGLEFFFDTRYFALSQEDEYIILSTIDDKSSFKSASLKVLREDDIQNNFQSLTYIETVMDNGVGKALYSYKRPSFLDDSTESVEYLTVIYKRFPNNVTPYLQIWGYNFKEDIQLTSILSKMMESSSLPNEATSNSEVLSATVSSINQAQLLGQASTLRIFSKECNSVMFSNELYDLNIGGKTYTICSAGFGSGFVVNDNGYIVTNAHVANANNLDSLIEGWSEDGTYELDFITDIINFLESEFDDVTISQITEEEMINFVTILLAELYDQGYITITDKEREIYIQGSEIFTIDEESGSLLDKENYFKANLVESNDLSSFYQSLLSEETYITQVADLAVLQVDGEFNFPSIPIISSGYSTGQTIYVVGYPGIADDSELISTTQVLSSSVTKGSISAIKPNTNNTYDLIQIDAAIQGGNSGGPIIDEQGNVVGVATYSLSSDSGNFNYGVSGKELLSFLTNSSVEPQINSLRSNLQNTLSDASLGYYKRAKESLEQILITQPALTVTLQPILDLCDEKIAAGEDRSPIFNTNNKVLMIGIFVVLILLLIISIIILSISLKKIYSKKKELPQTPNLIT